MRAIFLDELNRIKILSDKKIIIVGEGKIGKVLNDFLVDTDYRIEAFLVDDGFRKQKLYKNIPIYEMSEFLKRKNAEDYIFLNTITSKDSGSYREELVRKGIIDVLDFNDADMAVKMALKYWLKYFESKGIETSNEILKIGEFTFPNPFLNTVAEDIQYAFLTDVGDLVIPIWLNDYDGCGEGPYETEHVKINCGDIVIDCGANIGISTANAIARKCKKVYSIEPILNDSLVKCQKIFGERMSLRLLAFSDYEGIADIYINPEACNDNSIYYVQNTLKEKRVVSVTTLDKFVLNEGIQKVDYIKFYIDDLECRMLFGAKETIMKHMPNIAIFPYLGHDTNEFKEKLAHIIKSFNENYTIEYAWNKMFAYIK